MQIKNTWYKHIEVDYCSFRFVKSVVEAYHGHIIAINDRALQDLLPEQLDHIQEQKNVKYLLKISVFNSNLTLEHDVIVHVLKKGEENWFD